MDHVCHQKEIVDAIGSKVDEMKAELADGHVSFTEIKAMLKAQDVRSDTADKSIQEKLNLIKEQTTKTNGRVTKLEELALKPKFGWPAACASVLAAFTICSSINHIASQLIDSHNARVDRLANGLGIPKVLEKEGH